VYVAYARRRNELSNANMTYSLTPVTYMAIDARLLSVAGTGIMTAAIL
jgi:hypothetical protein